MSILRRLERLEKNAMDNTFKVYVYTTQKEQIIDNEVIPKHYIRHEDNVKLTEGEFKAEGKNRSSNEYIINLVPVDPKTYRKG